MEEQEAREHKGIKVLMYLVRVITLDNKDFSSWTPFGVCYRFCFC